MAGNSSDSFDPFGSVRSFFYPDSQPPLSYAAIQTRREIAKAIAARRQQAYPKTIGEGLSALGEGIATRRQMSELDALESRLDEQEKLKGQQFAGVPGYTQAPTSAPPGPPQERYSNPYQPPANPQPQPAAPPASTVPLGVTPDKVTSTGEPEEDLPVNAFAKSLPAADVEEIRNRLSAMALARGVPLGGDPGSFTEAPGRAAAQAPVQDQAPVAQPLPQLSPIMAAGSDEPQVAQSARDNPPIVRDDLKPPNLLMPLSVEAPTTQAPSGFGRSQSPSMEPIQELSEQVPPPVMDPLKRPGFVPPSPAMVEALSIMNNPRYSPEFRATAKQRYEVEDALRKQMEQVNTEEYTHLRGRRDAQELKFNEWVQGKAKRILDEQTARYGLENTAVTIAKSKAELSDLLYKMGRPRQQADEKADLEIEHAKQQVAAGVPRHVQEFDKGQKLIYNPATGGYDEPAIPKQRPEDIETTAEQNKTIKFLQRAEFANRYLAKNDEILTKFWDQNLGNTPVVGNYFRSAEYRRTLPLQMAWAQAVLRDESGAVINADELAKKLDTYFARPGDDKQTIEIKRQLRRNEEDSLARSLGRARPIYDQYLQERAARKVDESQRGNFQEGIIYEKNGKRRIYHNGYLEDL